MFTNILKRIAYLLNPENFPKAPGSVKLAKVKGKANRSEDLCTTGSDRYWDDTRYSMLYSSHPFNVWNDD